jgi:multisubunit Na+/H+ antiporter MnhG subunit
MAGLVADVLLWAGVAVLVVAALGCTLARDVRDRLHHVSLAVMAGLPLVVVSQCVAHPSQVPKLLVILAVQVVGAPALTAATARATVR